MAIAAKKNTDTALIAALQRERWAYEVNGLVDRAAEVAQRLRELGVKVEKQEDQPASRPRRSSR